MKRTENGYVTNFFKFQSPVSKSAVYELHVSREEDATMVFMLRAFGAKALRPFLVSYESVLPQTCKDIEEAM